MVVVKEEYIWWNWYSTDLYEYQRKEMKEKMAEAVISRAASGGSCLFAGMTLDQYNALIEDRVIIAASSDSAGESTYRTGGTYTFTAPKTTTYEVICIGGGGGGGAGDVDSWEGNHYGGGGGAGYINSSVISLNRGDIVTIQVGTGGKLQSSTTGANAPKWGGTGGTSMFGSYISAIGGGGGGASYRIYDDGSYQVNGIKANSGSRVPSTSKPTTGGTGYIVPDLTNGIIGQGGDGGDTVGQFGNTTVSNGQPGCVWIRWN